MDAVTYVLSGENLLISRQPTIQEQRFSKGMTTVMKKLAERVRGNRASFDSVIFGRVEYWERRRGKVWFSKILFAEKEFEYLDMRHGVTYAIHKLTGEYIALSISLDKKAVEFRFIDGCRFSDKV